MNLCANRRALPCPSSNNKNTCTADAISHVKAWQDGWMAMHASIWVNQGAQVHAKFPLLACPASLYSLPASLYSLPALAPCKGDSATTLQRGLCNNTLTQQTKRVDGAVSHTQSAGWLRGTHRHVGYNCRQQHNTTNQGLGRNQSPSTTITQAEHVNHHSSTRLAQTHTHTHTLAHTSEHGALKLPEIKQALQLLS
jgi:hypothetical protein